MLLMYSRCFFTINSRSTSRWNKSTEYGPNRRKNIKDIEVYGNP